MKILHVWRENGIFYRIAQYGDYGTLMVEYMIPEGVWLAEELLPDGVLEDRE